MGPKKTLERIKYSYFWEDLRVDVKKFCESCKECQLTRVVRINDRSLITIVARPELQFKVVNLDLIGPIDPPSLKGYKYILTIKDIKTELEKLGFSGRLDKLSFVAERIKYLGHVIVEGKHGPVEDNILAIQRLNRPTTKKEVRSVLGLMGFYCADIPNYPRYLLRLQVQPRKINPMTFQGGETEQNAFDKLKELLCEVTSFATSDDNLSFQVHCDATDNDVECCLTKQDAE
ncbi:retrovirus-related Pol polyprotein from transposon opus [Nephila pilipes]|uniref:RNA-directed DNA polymerase n=1 Tax=Nephila pilipes TaxID=299642 RepID=A0A8X6NCV9_NEPPI|nr:retrovirus-related Pol polyprotein from transposon opus [Nephila pilipes]